MPTLFMKRHGEALFPADAESQAVLAKVGFDKMVKVDVKMSRNVRFHNLYFKLCQRIGEGVGKDAEAISVVFKYGTGWVETFKSKSYGEIIVPKSIAFAKMDETSFREFYEKCLQVALEVWQIDPADISDLVDPKTVQTR